MEKLNMRRTMTVAGIAALAAVTFTACESEAEVVSSNISTAADNFEIDRKITFINGITGGTPLIIEGKCSIEADTADEQLEVTCKIDDTGEDRDDYYKHFLGLSDNMSYIVEQTEPADVDPFHHRVIIRPETLIPDFDVETSGEN
jgi:hypothetical protein